MTGSQSCSGTVRKRVPCKMAPSSPIATPLSIGNSSNSTCPEMEHKFASEEPSASSIDLAEVALVGGRRVVDPDRLGIRRIEQESTKSLPLRHGLAFQLRIQRSKAEEPVVTQPAVR